MRLLVDRGAHPRITTHEGTTPLAVAAGVGFNEGQRQPPDAQVLEALGLTIALGNDVRLANIHGQTPLHGGYLRYTGRVSVFPAPAATDSPPYQADVDATVLADRLDMPTNITLAADGSLYVSTGQGTPNRPIPGPDGPTRIVGEVIRITLPDVDPQ
jgi:hypothetical protein